jgi:sugar (pentulose or hexulose) kinase
MAVTGLLCQVFPQTLEPESLAGGLTAEAAQAFGLPPGTPVVVGLHDGAAANIGVRAVNAGDACITLGTNFVFRPATGERLTTRCFSYRIAPNRWAWVNNVPIASPQLDIAAELLLPKIAEMPERHRCLGALATAAAPGCNGLVVQRALAGQEAQFRQRVQSAIQADYDAGHIYRATLEAIAYGVLDLVNTAKRDGARPHRYVASGGSNQNIAFLQVLAALLNAPIEIGRAEAGLLGAGMAAALYSGWYATLDQAMAAMTSPHPVVDPDPAAVEYYHREQR